MRRFPRHATLAVLAAAIITAPAFAIDIIGMGNGSLDQPKVNVVLRVQPTPGVPSPNAPLQSPDNGDLADLFAELGLNPDDFGLSSTNISAFYDTGAGVGLLGGLTAQQFNVPKQTGAEFADVGIGGLDFFELTQRLSVHLASTSPDFNPNADLVNFSNYNHAFIDRHLAIGDSATAGLGLDSNDPIDQVIEQYLGSLYDFNVLGMPYFSGKSVVMDARALNSFAHSGELDLDSVPQLYTHVYDHGSAPAFNPANLNSPGAPTAAQFDLTLQLEFADFSGLTHTTGGTPPSLAHNPMIGGNLPNHFNPDADTDLPGVTIGYGGAETEGVWLFDTGAAASIISLQQAANLGITYAPGFEPTAEGPVKLQHNGVDLPAFDQFNLQVTGVGGTVTIAGFFLDTLTLDTAPESVTFGQAPVLVADIAIDDPDSPGGTFVLDGVFGMNFLFATTFIDGPIDLFGGGLNELALIPGAFDFVTYDEVTNTLGLIFATDFIASLVLTGDANNDGVVDDADFLAVEANFGNTGHANGWLLGDANNDGRVDGADYLTVERHFGATLEAPAIPEPAAAMLLLLGVAPALIARRGAWGVGSR